MKKNFKMLLVLVLFGVIFITGCGKSNLKDVAGTYEGEYTKFVGDPDTAKDESEFSLVLNEDGTGKHNRDGESFDVKWSVDGEKFSMTETFLGITNEYTGTLKEGKLDIFNGDPENDFTAEYVYTKK